MVTLIYVTQQVKLHHHFLALRIIHMAFLTYGHYAHDRTA